MAQLIRENWINGRYRTGIIGTVLQQERGRVVRVQDCYNWYCSSAGERASGEGTELL